ncbi:MAG: hypothetical protein Q9204_004982, partial [Flavoplaca sp. TL-2023a]
MDFTPDSKDFEVDDDDLMPRREEPMFEGDIFTPSWEHGLPASTPNFHIRPSLNNAKGGENQDLLLPDVPTSAQLLTTIRMNDPTGFYSILMQDQELVVSSDDLGRTPLHYAAESGGIRIIDMVFSYHPDAKKAINGNAIQGETCLMLAASQGHQDVVALLINNQADIHATSVTGKTALDEAIEAGFMQIAGLLLSRMTEEERSKYGLRVANRQVRQAAEGSATGKKILDLEYQSTKQVDDDQLFPLHNAVVLGDLSTISFLLSQNSTDIEGYSRSGRKPLMLAALSDHGEVIQLLLNHGADINSTSTKGWTTLMHAVREGNRAVVQQLIELGADVNHLSPDRWTALAEATYRGHRDITALLVQQGADTKSRSSHDYTPLMYASYKGDEKAVDLLLQAGANKDVSTSHDETAVLLAAAGGHTGIVILLLDAGAKAEPDWARDPIDISKEGKQQAKEKAVGEPDIRAHARGWTPLMLACQGVHKEIARILLENGVSTEVKSPYDKTALEIALENGWKDMEMMIYKYTIIRRFNHTSRQKLTLE